MVNSFDSIKEERSIEIYWQDLMPAKRIEIINKLGDNNNWDFIPIATIEVEYEESDNLITTTPIHRDSEQQQQQQQQQINHATGLPYKKLPYAAQYAMEAMAELLNQMVETDNWYQTDYEDTFPDINAALASLADEYNIDVRLIAPEDVEDEEDEEDEDAEDEEGWDDYYEPDYPEGYGGSEDLEDQLVTLLTLQFDIEEE